MRNKARKCWEKAREHLDKGTEDSIRYACLELRFAIEYLAYDLLKTYLEELPDDAMKKWQPKQVIEQMREVDQNADKSSVISYGIESTKGVPAKNLITLGEDKRFSLHWANKAHNTLGSFLHAPTLDQIEKNKIKSCVESVRIIEPIATVIKDVLSANIFNTNFGVFYTVECSCGKIIKRRKGSFSKEEGIICPSCKAIYDIVSEDVEHMHGVTKFLQRNTSYTCQKCGKTNFVGTHNLILGKILECECGAMSEIVLGLNQK